VAVGFKGSEGSSGLDGLTLEAKIQKDMHEPSLNIIQPREQLLDPVEHEYLHPSKEEIRLATAKAWADAFDHHADLHENKSWDYQRDAARFFDRNFGDGPPRPYGEIRIGTDCSGMEAPIQAAQNAGLIFDIVSVVTTTRYVLKPSKPIRNRKTSTQLLQEGITN